MRLARLVSGELCLVDGGELVDVSSALVALPSARYPYPRHDALIAALGDIAPALAAAARTGRRLPLAQARLASPVANPGKVIGAPVNYARHLGEALNDPGIHHDRQVETIQRAGCFLKAASSVIGAGEPVRVRFPERRTDHEVELAVVIGRRAANVHPPEALACVAGYCIGLDITVRGAEERSLRKSVDTYTVLGPWLVTADELGDPGNLALSLRVNGETRQEASTAELVLDVPALIAWCSEWYTLEPGDVLLTGTPQGVGPIRPGDTLEAEIERIGRMRVQVAGA